MKHLLLALLFFSFFELKICFAQSYHSFPDSAAKWYETIWYGGDPTFDFYNYGYLFNLAHDTIIDEEKYSLIGFDSTFFKIFTYNGYIYDQGNYNYAVPGNLFEAIREDSTHKVWFRLFKSDISYWGLNLNVFPLDSDILLYDFHIVTLLSEVNADKSISVFPIPASDFLNFDLSGFITSRSEISIYHSSGKLALHSYSLHTNQLKIPVDEIGGDGLYFYTVKVNDEKIFRDKFLIQR